MGFNLYYSNMVKDIILKKSPYTSIVNIFLHISIKKTTGKVNKISVGSFLESFANKNGLESFVSHNSFFLKFRIFK